MARTPSTFDPDSNIEGVSPQDIMDNAIEARHIGAGEVVAAALADDAIDSDAIANLSVTTAKIALLAVDTEQIAADAIENDKIGVKAVDTGEIADGAIESLQLNANAVETAKIADGNVTEAKIADSSITEAKLKGATASGITTGALACKVIATAELEALLNTSENTLFSMNAGDVIIEIGMNVRTAAGGACTVDIGPDATLRTAGADPDGFLINADANVAAPYSSENATYDGAVIAVDVFTADADGNITITSSTNQASASFVGYAYVKYIPA